MGTFSKLMPNESLPKWQLALIVTIPVAFGIGYLYYKSNIKTDGILVNKTNHKEKIHSISTIEKEDIQAKTTSLTPARKAETLKEKGNVCFKEGNYEEAVRLYTEAIELCPPEESNQKSTYYQNRAATYERMNDFVKVIEDCTASLNLNKRYLKAIIRRAKAAEQLNNLDLSLEDLATACIVETYQNRRNIAELDRIAKATAERDIRDYIANHEPKLPSRFFIKTYVSTYQHGSALDRVNMNDEKAVNLLNKFKSIEKALHACENIESSCQELIEECEEAGNELIKDETILLRATYNILSKQNTKAFSDLDKIIDKHDSDSRLKVNALIKRGTLYQHNMDNERRAADFNKAVEVDENNPDIYHHLGQIHLILDNPSESVTNFRKAVALDPDFPVTAVQHCYAEYKYALTQGDVDATFHFLNEFKNIMQKFPDNIECTTLYAQVLTERQEYAEGEKLFNEAIRREPKHAALLVHKALLLLQWKAEIAPAKKLIHEALELDSDCEFAYETMATIEMQMGSFQKAVDYFNEAIKRFSSVDELNHLFCVRNTSAAQVKAEERVGRLHPTNFFGGA